MSKKEQCPTCGQYITDYPGLGGLVRKYRLKAGLTQLELAKKVGYTSHVSIVHLETGRQGAPLETIKEVARLLGIPKKELANAVFD